MFDLPQNQQAQYLEIENPLVENSFNAFNDPEFFNFSSIFE